jgi:hypothetical protein
MSATATAFQSTLFPNVKIPKTTWPVWSNSTTKEVIFQPLRKKDAVKTWHQARKLESSSKVFGAQDGKIGRSGLLVLHALLFDSLNYATGALYPSYAEIAKNAGISISSVWRGLKKLRATGIVSWIRRCVGEMIDGRFSLRQESNAYAVLPASQWHGFNDASVAPRPESGTWGDHPPMPSVIESATNERDLKQKIAVLESDEGDALALALARLGRGILGKFC